MRNWNIQVFISTATIESLMMLEGHGVLISYFSLTHLQSAGFWLSIIYRAEPQPGLVFWTSAHTRKSHHSDNGFPFYTLIELSKVLCLNKRDVAHNFYFALPLVMCLWCRTLAPPSQSWKLRWFPSAWTWVITENCNGKITSILSTTLD